MLEDYFSHPQTLRWLRLGPFGSHMNDLADQLCANGYARHTAREILRGIAHFGRYAMWLGIASPTEISEEIGNQFLKEHLPTCSCERPNIGKFSGAASAVRHVLQYLHGAKIIRFIDKIIPQDSVSEVLAAYDKYLAEIRGVSPKTIDLYMRQGSRFLMHRLTRRSDLSLSKLTSKNIIEYLAVALDYHHTLDWRRTIITSLRSFLRFLRWERIIEVDLTRSVPSIIRWKLADIPSHIPFSSVLTLINAPNRSILTGKRDRAILTLLGLLGLRASEILGLSLDHIDWHNKTILIASGKSRRARSLPLIDEVADALSDYIQASSLDHQKYRTLFLSVKAPIQPILTGGCLTGIVRKYIRMTGIDAPKQGTHLLRHSLATKLVNSSVPLKEIADILGHSCLNNTRIYTKVDLGKLKTVALPFPSLAGGER
ncbi:tyrosine-type recombinase/integrase [bacterium]|nr:tyrosine-type recombinase/integrase [bacterium]